MIVSLVIRFALVLLSIFLINLVYSFILYLMPQSMIKDTLILSSIKAPDSTATTRTDKPKQRAVIICNAYPPRVPVRFKAVGYSDCRIQSEVFDGNLLCEHGCLGLGSCARVCPMNAIVLTKGIISVTSACDGCGTCISSCPQRLIKLRHIDDITKAYCAASGKSDESAICETAQKAYSLDFTVFSR